MERLTGRSFGICRAAAVIGVCGPALAGCGKNADQGPLSKGQVVAHVGNEVVTTQELENEFRLANIPPDKQKDPATVKRVLNELVLRKYLQQQALNAKLDREPRVLLDLLRARSQVLANAFLCERLLPRRSVRKTSTSISPTIPRNLPIASFFGGTDCLSDRSQHAGSCRRQQGRDVAG